jgi:hypothetical protein
MWLMMGEILPHLCCLGALWNWFTYCASHLLFPTSCIFSIFLTSDVSISILILELFRILLQPFWCFFECFVAWSFKIIIHLHLGVHKIISLFGSLLTVFFTVCGNSCLLLVSLGVQLVATQCHCVLCVAMDVLFWLDRFCVHILHRTGQCVLKNYADFHSMWLVALCSVLCLYIILLDGTCFVIKCLSFVVLLYMYVRCPFLPLLIHA